MMISLALNDVYVTLHSENSNEHSHCGWPGKCFLFVCTFSRLLIMLSSDLTISDMTFVIILSLSLFYFYSITLSNVSNVKYIYTFLFKTQISRIQQDSNYHRGHIQWS